MGFRHVITSLTVLGLIASGNVVALGQTIDDRSIFEDSEPSTVETPPSVAAPPPVLTPAQEHRRAREQRKAIAEQVLIEQLRKAIDDGQYSQTYPILVDLRKKAGNVPKPAVDGLLARVALAENQPDKAWAYVKSFSVKREVYDPTLAGVHLAAADTLLASGKPHEAQALFDWIANHEKGRSLALAAEGVGRCFVQMEDYRQAISCFEFAARVAGTLREYDNESEYDWLRARITKEMTNARRLWDARQYGPDFVAYRNAERLRRAGKADEAIKAFEELIRLYPTTTYAEAAALYRCYALRDLGKAGEALTAAQRLVRVNPEGLYAGETQLLIGRITLEEALDVKTASTAFDAVFEWVADRKSAPAAPIKINPGAVEITRGPASEYVEGGFGFLQRRTYEPGQLFNAETCSWYLDWLKKEAVIGRGFQIIVDRDAKRGQTFFRQLIALDDEIAEHTKYDLPSVVTRLTASSKSGLIRSTRDEMRGLSGKAGQACLLGDYFYSCTLNDRSKRIFEGVLSGRYGEANLATRAYAVAGLGANEYIQGNFDAAAKHFKRFNDEFRASPWVQQGLFSYAQSLYQRYNFGLRQSPQKPNSAGRRALMEEWDAAYAAAARIDPNSRFGVQAVFTAAFIKCTSREYRTEGYAMMRDIMRRHGNAKDPMVRQWADLAQKTIDHCEKHDVPDSME